MKKLREILGIATPLVLAASGCAPTTTTPGGSTTTTTIEPGTVVAIAMGDSQAGGSNDPARGLPWSERLGSKVFNGTPNNHGGGYVVPGTFTGRNMADQIVFAKGQAPEAQYVIMMAGTNDLAIHTAEEIETKINLADAVSTANGMSARIALIIPSNSISYTQAYEAKRNEVNNFIQAAYGDRAIDCNPVLDVDGDGKLDQDKTLNDGGGFHLNDLGEAEFSACLINAVGPELGL